MKGASVGRAELLLLSGSFGVVLLAVVVAEMGLPFINPHRLDRREAGEEVYSEWYGWENRRGFQGPLHGVPTTVDSSGRRSPGRITRDSAPRPRVLMLGDSITFGSGVRDEETFCALMAQRYDIVNLGVEGYGTDQELLKLEREGLAYHPDAVVLNFTVANDIWNVRTRFDDVTRLPKPYFTLVGGAPVLHREHLRRSPLGALDSISTDHGASPSPRGTQTSRGAQGYPVRERGDFPLRARSSTRT